MEPREGTVIAERFRLEHKLGEGGMGTVWSAQHTTLHTPCAVKLIHADIARDPEIRARFEREAQAAAQLRSPHVVQILDYGVFEGAPYIAMERLVGEDLAHRLATVGRLSGEETLGVVEAVAKALSRAHAAGLVHRDLKPENIFLARDDDGAVTVKVLDFGIAKRTQGRLESGATKTGALLGTPFYMSPEQAQGIKSVDHRADLWALGVITFRCLVGRLPFESEAIGDLFLKIMVQPIPVPSALAPDLPRAFDGFWARASAREPAERFQSARELADALRASLAGAPERRPNAGEVQPYAATISDAGLGRSDPAPLVAAALTPSYAASPAAAFTPTALAGGAAAPSPTPQRAPTPGDLTTLPVPPPPRAASLDGSVLAAPLATRRSSARVAAAALGVLALGGLGAGAWLLLRGPTEPPPAPAATASVAPPAETAAPVELAAPATSDSVAEPAASPSASTPKASAKPAKPAAPPAATPAAKPSNAPPASTRTGRVVIAPPG